MAPIPFRFRELLTMAELAAYLHKPSGEAARKWARRHGLPMAKVGREWRVDLRDVDRVIAEDTRRAERIAQRQRLQAEDEPRAFHIGAEPGDFDAPFSVRH